MQFEFQTDSGVKVSLRELNENDFHEFHYMVKNNLSILSSFFAGTVSKNKDLNASQEFVSNMCEKRKCGTCYPYVIIDNNTGYFIGFFVARDFDISVPKCELGLFVDKRYHNDRIAFNVLKWFEEYLFEVLAVNKIFLRTHAENIPAIVLAESLGFELEGKIKCDYRTGDNRLVDLLYYGKVNKKNFHDFLR